MEELIKKSPMNDVMKELEEGVTNLFESDTYKNYLDVICRDFSLKRLKDLVSLDVEFPLWFHFLIVACDWGLKV